MMASGVVRDAETGEELELFVWTHQQQLSASRSSSKLAPSPASNHPSTAASTICLETTAVHAETQSTRYIGGRVGWQQQQNAVVENADRRFRSSLAGVRLELQRRDLSDAARRELQLELLEKTKRQYAQHVQSLVLAEAAREQERQVQAKLELSAIGKERLHRRHEQERDAGRAQIERVRGECELALTSAMARFNLLR